MQNNFILKKVRSFVSLLAQKFKKSSNVFSTTCLFVIKHSKIIKKLLLILATILIVSGAVVFYEVCYRNYYLTLAGVVEFNDSMGRQTIDFENIVGDEIEMNTTATVRSLNNLPERFKKVLKRKNKKLGNVVLYEFHFPFRFQNEVTFNEEMFNQKTFKYRNSFNQLPRDKQIFIYYSMIESDRIPNFWVYEINKNWDMIVVPDQNLVKIYLDSGVTKPIFVLPLGTNLQDHLDAPLKSKANKTFTFANFSFLEDRKNLLKLVEAFHKSFKDNENTRLLLAPRGYEEQDKIALMEYILKNNIANITIDIGIKDNNFYNFYFTEVDCYVSPSKGEGFSIIPREAMARGIPTIVSDAIAQKTIAESGLVKSLKANIPIPGYYTRNRNLVGNFYDIDVDDLSNAMLDVYNNYQSYLDKASAARAWAEKGQYKYLKEEYLNMVKPKKVILGDRNEITKDYLMTNSKELYDKFLNLNLD